jgi:hypothetical protein
MELADYLSGSLFIGLTDVRRLRTAKGCKVCKDNYVLSDFFRFDFFRREMFVNGVS